MIIGNWEVLPDGETVVVMKIGKNGKTGEKTLVPTAYVRDVIGGLEVVQRRMGVEAFAKESSATKILALLKKQHDVLLTTVKSECKECLKK